MPCLRQRSVRSGRIAISIADSLYAQVRVIGFSVRPSPYSNPTVAVSKFKVVHEKARLIGTVHIQLGVRPRNHDLDPRPCLFLDVDIGFVNSRTFLPQARPRKIWKCTVLCGVIATELVVSASVCEAQIEVLKLINIALNAKGHSNEAAALAIRSLSRHPNQVNFDGSVFEIRTFDDGQRFPTGRSGGAQSRVVVEQVESAPAVVTCNVGFDSHRLLTRLRNSLDL